MRDSNCGTFGRAVWRDIFDCRDTHWDDDGPGIRID
jgi:hypothetical protein